jgi:hypothetical protein
MAWITDSILTKERPDLHVNKLEALWLELSIPKHKILLATCYRQQVGTYGDDFWDKLQKSYDQAKSTNIPNIIMIGDFNADAQTDKVSAENLDFIMANNHLSQHITEPTRYIPGLATKLDLIISNIPSLICNTNVLDPVHLNDHCTITGEITFKISKKKAYTRVMWDYKKANYDGMRESLNNQNWDEIFETDDINTICESWTAIMIAAVDKYVPHKKVTVRPNDKSWYNGYLRRLRKTKFKAHQKAIRLRTPDEWENYRQVRNWYFQECDRIKLEHEEKLEETMATQAKSNPKKWWSLAKQVMGGTKTTNLPSLTNQGKIIDTDVDKANCFN